MTELIHTARRYLGSPSPYEPLGLGLDTRHRAYARARWTIRVHYWLLAAVILRTLYANRGLADLSDLVSPLWPVAWVDAVGMPAGFYVTVAISVGGVVGAAVAPRRRWARTWCAVGLLLLGGLINSLGKINHGLHPWIFSCGVLVFLPTGHWQERAAEHGFRERFLLVVSAVQAFLLLFYSLSGLAKVLVGLGQLVARQVNAFHPMAFAHQIANRVGQTNIDPPLANFFLSNPWLGWPLYLGALYLEAFAFLAVLRPRLHRPWGIGLVALHLGIYLSMGIN